MKQGTPDPVPDDTGEISAEVDSPGGIHAIFNNLKVRKTLLALRKPLFLVLGIGMVFYIDPEWFYIGLAVSLFGMLFQLWCFSCIKTSSELAVSGPYAFTRNPMYIARFFLSLGIIMFLGNWYITAVFVVLYYLYMVNRVRREEMKLKKIFGEPYEDYCRKVNRFIPSFLPYPQAKIIDSNKESFRRNHGLTFLITMLVFYCIAWAVTFLWQN
jgi:protein-S-isoprenylcysteine O-methyltransferase Ste14